MEVAVRASYTRTQAERASVRQSRTTHLAQAVEREARIEKSATAAVLAGEALQKVAEGLASAVGHVRAQLNALVSERLSVSEIATLTGIPQRSCRPLIRALPHHVSIAGDGQNITVERQSSNLEQGQARR